MKLGQYSDALELKYDKNSKDRDTVLKCTFNDILSFKKLERYDEALSEITKLNEFLQKDDREFFIRNKMLEANILDKKEDFYSAIKIYTNLLSKCKSGENFVLIRSNLLRLKITSGTCKLADLKEFSALDLSEKVLPEKLILSYKTLSEGYEEFDMDESVSYFKKSLDIILAQPVISAETKHYFNGLIENVLNVKTKMEVFLKESPDDFKTLIATSLNKNLLDNDTVFKVLHYFQNREDYKFVNKLLESKVS